MSRTYKDQPARVRWPEPYDHDMVRIPGTWRCLQLPTTRAKKPKHVDTECHWMSTPSWWTRLTMNRPQRRRENRQLHMLQDFENFDFVDTGRKPHIYYW